MITTPKFPPPLGEGKSEGKWEGIFVRADLDVRPPPGTNGIKKDQLGTHILDEP